MANSLINAIMGGADMSAMGSVEDLLGDQVVSQTPYKKKADRQSAEAYYDALNSGIIPPDMDRRAFAILPQDTYMQAVNSQVRKRPPAEAPANYVEAPSAPQATAVDESSGGSDPIAAAVEQARQERNAPVDINDPKFSFFPGQATVAAANSAPPDSAPAVSKSDTGEEPGTGGMFAITDDLGVHDFKDAKTRDKYLARRTSEIARKDLVQRSNTAAAQVGSLARKARLGLIPADVAAEQSRAIGQQIGNLDPMVGDDGYATPEFTQRNPQGAMLLNEAARVKAQMALGNKQVDQQGNLGGRAIDVQAKQVEAGRDVGLAGAGAQRDVGLAGADAQKTVGVGANAVAADRVAADERLGGKQVDASVKLGEGGFARDEKLKGIEKEMNERAAVAQETINNRSETGATDRATIGAKSALDVTGAQETGATTRAGIGAKSALDVTNAQGKNELNVTNAQGKNALNVTNAQGKNDLNVTNAQGKNTVNAVNAQGRNELNTTNAQGRNTVNAVNAQNKGALDVAKQQGKTEIGVAGVNGKTALNVAKVGEAGATARTKLSANADVRGKQIIANSQEREARINVNGMTQAEKIRAATASKQIKNEHIRDMKSLDINKTMSEAQIDNMVKMTGIERDKLTNDHTARILALDITEKEVQRKYDTQIALGANDLDAKKYAIDQTRDAVGSEMADRAADRTFNYAELGYKAYMSSEQLAEEKLNSAANRKNTEAVAGLNKRTMAMNEENAVVEREIGRLDAKTRAGTATLQEKRALIDAQNRKDQLANETNSVNSEIELKKKQIEEMTIKNEHLANEAKSKAALDKLYPKDTYPDVRERLNVIEADIGTSRSDIEAAVKKGVTPPLINKYLDDLKGEQSIYDQTWSDDTTEFRSYAINRLGKVLGSDLLATQMVMGHTPEEQSGWGPWGYGPGASQ
jgi:predicted metal-dependent hydrolase